MHPDGRESRQGDSPFFLLVVGCWLLFVDCWWLVVGGWFLVFGCTPAPLGQAWRTPSPWELRKTTCIIPTQQRTTNNEQQTTNNMHNPYPTTTNKQPTTSKLIYNPDCDT